jgi:hypothetical protein
MFEKYPAMLEQAGCPVSLDHYRRRVDGDFARSENLSQRFPLGLVCRFFNNTPTRKDEKIVN